jgi:diaminohydroxyphosphoribosylaminopyrimidine deaminase/5-amino-6-(5-phosphoribosylamino)uracil reductase
VDDIHEQYLSQAIELARRAEGDTRPNPMVGCVVVREGEVLARGYHHQAGDAHGEVDALQKLAPGEARGADLYVNLEPCCVHGRTPPCTEAIVDAGIKRVFIGTVDTNPRVQGAGIEALRAAGIEVVVGVSEEDSRRVNEAYFKTMEEGRPFVSAKWAMSLDGKIGTHSGESAWITGEAARRRVHQLRDTHDAVLVGTGTLLADDPRLTCRIDAGRDPVRVVLDARLRAPLSSRVYDREGTVVFVDEAIAEERASELTEKRASVVGLPTDAQGRFEARQVLASLLDFDVMSVLVEGGGTLFGTLFDAGLVDRVYAFVAPVVLGGRDAIPAVGGEGVERMASALRLRDVRVEPIGEDVLVVGDV